MFYVASADRQHPRRARGFVNLEVRRVNRHKAVLGVRVGVPGMSCVQTCGEFRVLGISQCLICVCHILRSDLYTCRREEGEILLEDLVFNRAPGGLLNGGWKSGQIYCRVGFQRLFEVAVGWRGRLC